MKEITRIYTLEITTISKDGKDMMPKDEAKKGMEDFFKNVVGTDDCVVTNVQDFEMEVDE